MKLRIFSAAFWGITLLALFTSIFGTFSAGFAQTSQIWSDPINLSNSGSSTGPSMVVDSTGTIHVIWVDQIDGYKYVRSTDGGKTWTAPKSISFPFSPTEDTQPVLLAGRNAEIHIFWQDAKLALFSSVATSQTFDQPSAWTKPSKLSEAVLAFDAVVSAKDILHVGYVHSGSKTSTAGIYYQRFEVGSWSAAKVLYSSQYFRGLQPPNANISLSVTSDSSQDRVLASWDDQSQKRIFWSESRDGGNVWAKPVEASGPESYSGAEMPFNLQVGLIDRKLLLMWQVGMPGSRCTQYSQWSLDDGTTFSKPTKVLSESALCPKESEILLQNPDFSVGLLNIDNEISLIAWDGNRWSKPQPQSEISAFLDPVTLNNVLFGCQNISIYNQTLFVVGCDTGTGADVWFMQRPLGSLAEWFPPSSAWSAPVTVATTRQTLSSVTMAADNKSNIHAFWVQTPVSESEEGRATVVYARWDGEKWSKPANILSGFDGVPTQLSSTADKQGKLLLSWVDGTNGDIYFSWANADRANLASEWFAPQQLPSLSQLNSSPDVLVDDSDRIVIVYTVPLNENRGVYIVQSTDLGQTWSKPTLIFDAAAAGWSSVDRPVVTLSGDGNLHILFTRSSLRETEQLRGLFYSQSTDGGVTWSQPQTVSEKNIQWSQILCFDGKTIHRVWQENNGTSFDLFHQLSSDGGITWSNALKVTSNNNSLVLPELGASANGHLYLTEAYVQDNAPTLEVHEWDGTRWITQEKKQFDLDVEQAQTLITARINNEGFLNVLVSTVYPGLLDAVQNKIVGSSRSLDTSGNAGTNPVSARISTPVAPPTGSGIDGNQPSPTVASPLGNVSDTPAPPKNLIGIILVGIVAVVIFLFTRLGKKG